MEFLVSASNGYFSGRAEIYFNHDKLSEMAEVLSGFPSDPADSRDLELGTFDPNCADGGVRMHFRCRDSAGHPVAELKLRGDACKGMGELESVALLLPVEAAAIDTFVSQIRQMEKEVGATAYLEMEK